MKVANYYRISTDDKGQDIRVQSEKCREYDKLHNHEIIAEFLDEGVSGDTFYYERPEGKKLYELINKNKIEGIVVFSVDRFSRQNPMKVLPLIMNLKNRGIKFISVTESVFNMESEFAEPLQYMLSWFSNYFLVQHKVKVNAGIKKARKFGTKSGKPIGRERKADYDKVREIYQQNKNITQTAKQLGISKSSVVNAIKSKTTSF
jgi:DNA invertase Pin-like site-specific DNA recombinase